MGDREPLITAGVIASLVAAILVLLKTLGFPLTDEQQGAITTVVGIAAPLILAFIARQFVYSPATAARINDIAYAAGMDNVPQPSIPPPPAKDLGE